MNNKILPVIIFWGALILLAWWLMAREDNNTYLYDEYWPDDGKSGCIYGPSGDCL